MTWHGMRDGDLIVRTHNLLLLRSAVEMREGEGT
jgi:hypothetical protein